jgi:iron complex transport system permease protein
VRRDRAYVVLGGLGLAAPLAVIWALNTGSLATDWTVVWRAFTTEDAASAAVQAVRDLRAPRVFAAFTVGGLLALAGCLMQVLLRNPLADPYVLGVSGGASVAALSAMLLGGGGAWIATGAFGGAAFATLLVFGLSRASVDPRTDRLLLTGVVIAAGFGAVISLLLTLAPDARVHGMLFWLLGDLSHADRPWLGASALALGWLIAMHRARDLNVLTRGTEIAETLGVDTARLRTLMYFLTSLLAAMAVVLAGAVGFVGLVIPHLLRRAGLTDHRLLLPGVVLAGGSFLVVADTLARSLAAPTQLPVGVLTAVIGTPVFLYLLHRGSRP